ncbi:MAG: (E)-4-hydroxy-3-methylbut-2-enyl-diphosphate synthase [Verrucomicrobiales bacterium]|jgi:(E)-4-hydroxy-3-methylbut-2-enyl-diphosphate synthase
MLTFCDSALGYARRETREVHVGSVAIGGQNPIRVQSMLTSDTREIDACIEETLGLVEVGCEIVRLTAQTPKIASCLEQIKAGLLERGCEVPLVADIHFQPAAALEAAKWVEKVRVNPGNYADSKKFAILEYTDEEYAEELSRIKAKFAPLVGLCIERGVAMRIGTNHGSLSDRIMNRFGDTPLGMVESALEFAQIARDRDYHNFVFSMKASNPKVMIEAYRLLIARLREAGPDWNYPIHLGVTEAGDGEDGRIKSAIGIGSLLSDGIGDTIRVSLTEDSVYEIPVARELLRTVVDPLRSGIRQNSDVSPSFDPFSYDRRKSGNLEIAGIPIGGAETFRVCVTQAHWNAVAPRLTQLGEFQPEFIHETSGVVEIDPRNADAITKINSAPGQQLLSVANGLEIPVVTAFRLLAAKADPRHPILLKDTLQPDATGGLPAMLRAGTNIGSLLCDGIGDAILIQGEPDPDAALRLAYNTLQAAGSRIFKTDYVACPSCGRTLFNLQSTTQKIREATGHLKGVRIAVMGCIVNGPGEMADADFGYVGGAPDKINLYVGKEAVEMSIPENEAVSRLIELIKKHDRWFEAEETVDFETVDGGLETVEV